MCLAFVAFGVHPKHPLVIVTNRDEEYDRPREPARFWPEHPQIFAGKDLRRGGAWCGVNRSGRFALVTFVRERRGRARLLRSCGELVRDFLREDARPLEYLAKVHADREEFRGFNLIIGSPGAVYHYSNRGGLVSALPCGVHGVSNALLNTPWPKVEQGKEALRMLLGGEELSLEAACRVMADRTRAARSELPRTGYPEDHEWVLSSRFVVAPEIGEGTLATTVIRYNSDGTIDVRERSFGRDGIFEGEETARISMSNGTEAGSVH